MSDVLNGLGSVPLLRMFPNFATNPKYSFLNSLKIIEFAGSPTDFYEVSARKPQVFQVEITLASKAEEFAFMTFWKSRKGMVERFWLPMFPDLFELQAGFLASDTNVPIEPVQIPFNKERVYILANDDYIWTAKVASYSTDDDKTILTLSDASGRDMSITDVNSFGMLMLCRFDKETIQLDHETAGVIKVSLDVKEVMEYTEV